MEDIHGVTLKMKVSPEVGHGIFLLAVVSPWFHPGRVDAATSGPPFVLPRFFQVPIAMLVMIWGKMPP